MGLTFNNLPSDLNPKLKTGSERTLKVSKFEFAETTGASTAAQLTVLENVLRNLKQAAGLSGLSYSKEAIEASGYSKEFELAGLISSLKSYGAIILTFYQDLLDKILEIHMPSMGSGVAHLSGLEVFDLDSSESTLQHFKDIKEAEIQLPETSQKRLMLRLARQLDPNADEETQAQVLKEVEAMVPPRSVGAAGSVGAADAE